jgi:5-methyltetrahydrofolate--homocysteine methyltransferase
MELHTPKPKIQQARLAIQRHLNGELILPELLRHLEDLRQSETALGTIVIATLPGDVHDIGTALLHSVLECAGYRVYDLGKQVPIERIIDAAIQAHTDAIGLSALLVTSSREMPLCIQALDARGLDIPVLVGGAAINRAFGRRSALLPDGRIYAAGVFYCRDVFEGLAILDALCDPGQRSQAIAQVRAEIASEREQPPPPLVRPHQGPAHIREVESPRPPYWGARRRSADLREVWRSLDRNTLFRFHWGGYRASGDSYARLVREYFEPTLEQLTQDALRDGWLEARVVIGYFGCHAESNAIVVDDDLRLEFPRQPEGEQLCLADYFSPQHDAVALQAVSAGPRAGLEVERLQREGQYERMLLVNGLASATAEALAEYAHQVVRRELALLPDQGLRFSWGYAACPDLAEQRKVLPLLKAEAEIGLRLTESSTLEPEHSTVAIVVHHPAVKYFAVR